jgi:hypothetical protein
MADPPASSKLEMTFPLKSGFTQKMGPGIRANLQQEAQGPGALLTGKKPDFKICLCF